MSRTEAILTLLSNVQKIEVHELARQLEVSEVTIRKDLDKLSARGILKREHGFAVLGSRDNLNYRLAINYPQKQKIVKQAALLVNDGATILLDSGSTCALLAEEIVATKHNVTIITNSLFIANLVSNQQTCQIVVLGGMFQADAQVCVGPVSKQQLQQLHVDLFFTGIDGFDPDSGFTGSDFMRVEVAQMMHTRATRTILLSDATKFATPGHIQQFHFSAIDTLYTDDKLNPTIKAQLQAAGIIVHTL